MNVDAMVAKYRKVRKAVFEEATRPESSSREGHVANQERFKQRLCSVCNDADLGKYQGADAETADSIWRHLWTKNRYAGIRASTASKEIDDIGFVFNDFRNFCSPTWDIKSKGHKLIDAGTDLCNFKNRTGSFTGRQTVANIPKLNKLIPLARSFDSYMESKPQEQKVIDFVTGELDYDDIWGIHSHLQEIGYTADLTALHFMMDMGFGVIKPDVVVSRLFFKWGWLHQIIEDLPCDMGAEDLVGKGKYRSRFLYTKKKIYRPIIELARRIVGSLRQSDLEEDIGWRTSNPLREFDLFVVKYGQKRELQWGIERCLAENDRP